MQLILHSQQRIKWTMIGKVVLRVKNIVEYLSPIFTFLTRVDMVILLSILVLGSCIFKDFAIMCRGNLFLAEMVTLTCEEAADAKRFAAAATLIGLVTMLIALFVSTQCAFSGAWNVYEPMLYEHPDFLLWCTLAIMVIVYFCLLVPIYLNCLCALYRQFVNCLCASYRQFVNWLCASYRQFVNCLCALYRQFVFLCGTKTAIAVLVTVVAFLCPFGFADCSGMDLSPMDAEIPSPTTREIATQTSTAPGPPDDDLPGGHGGFLEWLLGLCAELGITVSQELLEALKKFLSKFISYALYLSAFGMAMAFSWTVFAWVSPELATTIASFFQQLLDQLRNNGEKSELLLKIAINMRDDKDDLQDVHEVWTFYKVFTVLWLYYKWKSK